MTRTDGVASSPLRDLGGTTTTVVIERFTMLVGPSQSPSRALKQVRTLQIGGVLLGRSPLVFLLAADFRYQCP